MMLSISFVLVQLVVVMQQFDSPESVFFEPLQPFLHNKERFLHITINLGLCKPLFDGLEFHLLGSATTSRQPSALENTGMLISRRNFSSGSWQLPVREDLISP